VSSALPPHPFELFKQTYDRAAESWAKSMEQFISTEEFASAAGTFMERYANLQEAMRKAAEASFEQLPVPSKEDMARVAQLVINVERKLDEVSDSVFALQDRLDAPAPEPAALPEPPSAEAIAAALPQPPSAEAIAAALPQPPSAEAIAAAVRERLQADRLDVDALVQRIAGTVESSLAGRLAGLEARLDAVAAAQAAPPPAAEPPAPSLELPVGVEPPEEEAAVAEPDAAPAKPRPARRNTRAKKES
jgi:BMFP domain-containing protein YqiC